MTGSNSCGICNRETDMFLCWGCCRALKGCFATAAWLATELEITTARQARMTSLADRMGGARSRATLMPFHIAASECAWVLANTLNTWARELCEARALTYPADPGIRGVARWLKSNVVAVALSEGAVQCYGEVTAAVEAAHRVIDRPPGLLYVGPCGVQLATGVCEADLYVVMGQTEARCPACRSTHSVETRRAQLREQVRGLLGTAAELARLLPWVLDSPITRKRITYYARKGFISTRLHSGDTVYQIGEVIDAHIQCEARRSTHLPVCR